MFIGLEDAHVFYVSTFGEIEHFRRLASKGGCSAEMASSIDQTVQ
jgi:hypothetical protein